jgi:benzylsuccinate CoA-transferase BbsF subunit
MTMAAPLDGVHVLDLSWVMVGPVSARYLADLGADVIKVESSKRIDPVRTLGPFKDGKMGPERSVSYHNLNAGKRCITLDLRKPKGREIVLRLCEWADVALESFTPGVLDNLRLAYPDLSARNPRLIMVSTSILGQTGPDARGTSGVGTMGAAMSGATYQFGWPDRPPSGPFGPWTDAVTPRFIAAAVLAALHRRSRTGLGCYIDVAQAECGIQFMMPSYYEFALNRRIPERRGAAWPLAAPRGMYQCEGKDRWVAIDAASPEHWNRLRKIIGGPLADPRFDTIVGRMRARDDLDRIIGEWTRAREAQAVEAAMQSNKIPAHVVSRGEDLARDPDLRHAGHFRPIDDPVIGRVEIEGPRFEFDRTPTSPTRRGPRIGEHTLEILRDVCGISEDETARMADDGILA